MTDQIVEKNIEVNVPLSTAYNQWTQFEEFPKFMEGVESVQQLDDTRLRWVAEVAGQRKEWEARITEQIPDQIIAWKAESGAWNGGTVRFESAGADKTRVTVRFEYDPDGVVEKMGDALGFVGRRVDGDLGRFKEFIEGRGTETGAWRGTVGPQATSAGSTTGGAR
jgi:uncharacterized membrane protein